MKTNSKPSKKIDIPEFVNRIPTNFEFPVNLQVYEFIRNILLLKDITAKLDPESTDQCTHIFIKNGKKVLFEYIDSDLDKRACIYTGKGNLVAVDKVNLDYIAFLEDNKENKAPNYMDLISNLIFWKAHVSKKYLCADIRWLKNQPEYKPMIDYVVPALKNKHR